MLERDRLAALRQARIKRRQIVEGEADAAERHGERGRGLIGKLRLHPDVAEAAGELAGADGGEHLDGGDIERVLQRLAHGHGAVVALVEVLGRVGAEARGAILDQGFGVGDAGLEGETVDEGFQRRAGRAHGRHHVDGAEAIIVEIAGRADVGDHLAASVIDDEDGGRQLLSQELGLLLGQPFQRRLHVAVDGEPVHGLGRRRHHLRFRKMRSELGKGAALMRHRLEPGALGFGLGDHAGAGGALQHAITCGARGLGVAVGATLLGGLGQRNQQRGLADREVVRLLAEVGERGGAHAFDVAAERRQPQIEREDLPFR